MRMTPDGHGSSFGLARAICLLAVMFALTAVRYSPPAAKPATAPAGEFSAGRARQILQVLVGDGVPHPTGSDNNARVRDEIFALLDNLGYQPEIQTGFACDEFGTCGTVKNVVARLDGQDRNDAVLLAAHYDSVPAGPGASDDGAGAVTVLEIARILKQRPAPRNSIILLIDDGEEAGLLGAEVFVREHRWAKQVRAAVNVEARGTSGPSFMFETGSANDWAVRQFARTAADPITNSIAYTIYKYLPNDTDFTVFKRAGYQGLNFAFVNGVMHYHTPLDNFENASASSIQHQGDNALSSVLALADQDLSNMPVGDAVYFDFYTLGVARWPVSWAFPLALVAAALFLIEGAILLGNGELTAGKAVWGVIGVLGAIAVSVALSHVLLVFLRRAHAFPRASAEYGWVASPEAAKIAFCAISFIGVGTLAAAIGKRAGFWGAWIGAGIVFAAANVALSRLAPGTSFVAAVPAWAMVLGAMPSMSKKAGGARREIAVHVALAGAAVALFPTLWSLYDALGVTILPPRTDLLTILLLLLMPLMICASEWERRVFVFAPIAVLVVSGFAAAATEPYSVTEPERVNLNYLLDGNSHQAKWVVIADSGRLPASLAHSTGFDTRPQALFPWSGTNEFAAPAPTTDLAAPSMDTLEVSKTAGGTHYRLLVKSRRGAPDMLISFPPSPGLSAMTIGGFAMAEPDERVARYVQTMRKGWKTYEIVAMPPAGVEMSFDVAGPSSEIVLMDQSYALPLDGMFLLRARPSNTVASQDGDVTIVMNSGALPSSDAIPPAIPPKRPASVEKKP
jgi:hypothetical protein